MNKVKESFKLSLNTSTIMPYELDVVQQIDVVSKAGYDGVELWSKHLISYLDEGNNLKELKKYIDDKGLEVANGIAFFGWTDPDKNNRAKALEKAKNEMEMFAQLGCRYIAAPPMGEVEKVTLDQMASNYYDLYKVGQETGVKPILEVWGFAKKLSTWQEAAYIALASGVDDPKILIDIYHMYKGGNDVCGLNFFNQNSIGVVHVNDYPSMPSRDEIKDSDRVFTGDGVAPVAEYYKALKSIGYEGYLSLELFIKDYGTNDPLEVAKEGYRKMCAIDF